MSSASATTGKSSAQTRFEGERRRAGRSPSQVEPDMKATRDTGIGSGAQAGSNPRDIVVFWILRDSACAECGNELGQGRFLRMEGHRPLCLACADLDHL